MNVVKVTGSFLVSTLLPAMAAAQTTVPAQTPAPHQSPAKPQSERPHVVEIRMDDDFHPKTRTPLGRLEGFDPVVTVVHRGDRIRFVNVDDVEHTATGYAFGGATIPAHYKFQGDPSVSHGTAIVRSEWSTGNVAPHTRSKVFAVTTTGTFYYGDAYHAADMRGVIIVK